MGLDVYLYKCPNREGARRLQERYEAETAVLWEQMVGNRGWRTLSVAEHQDYNAKAALIAEQNEIVDGQCRTVQEIHLDSRKYPEHYFKIGYFRSPYNGSGINSYLGRLGLPDLHHVFVPAGRHEFVPDWDAARERTRGLVEGLKAHLESPMGALDACDIRAVRVAEKEGTPRNEREALAIYEKQLNGRQGQRNFMRAYFTCEGDFFLDGIKVHAILPGIARFDREPCVYVVYNTEQRGKLYLQALEIVWETIEYVLADEDKDQYYLHWSS